MLNEQLINRIGIEKITLYNFDIAFIDNKYKKYQTTNEYYQEKIFIKTEKARLEIYTKKELHSLNILDEFKQLSFNPNEIIYKHNNYNSRENELKKATEILVNHFANKGIKIDLTFAKIAKLEVNIGFCKPFEELVDIATVFLCSCPKVRRIAIGNKRFKSYKKMFIDQKIEAIWEDKECSFYRVESKETRYNPITRFKWKINSSPLNYYSKTLNLNLELSNVINNFENIDILFQKLFLKKIKIPTDNYIENEIKKNLDKGYTTFKKLAKQDKKTGTTIRRNVYKYLEDEYWIFDYSLLEELIRKYDKKNLKREITRIRNMYGNMTGFKHINLIINSIFPLKK
ncbi:hypothetical protein [Cetobacterium sp.]|uniref:hypothetical protein n=1 Tax=Cetobacterium sp. TaxID=2071632 RepID=UPI003EE752C5